MNGHGAFSWDETKNALNQTKHGVSFEDATAAFFDRARVILRDLEHSQDEDRFYCVGKAGEGILTVRFTTDDAHIRIFGAGYWRKGKKIYEAENRKKD